MGAQPEEAVARLVKRMDHGHCGEEILRGGPLALTPAPARTAHVPTCQWRLAHVPTCETDPGLGRTPWCLICCACLSLSLALCGRSLSGHNADEWHAMDLMLSMVCDAEPSVCVKPLVRWPEGRGEGESEGRERKREGERGGARFTVRETGLLEPPRPLHWRHHPPRLPPPGANRGCRRRRQKERRHHHPSLPSAPPTTMIPPDPRASSSSRRL